MENTRQIKKYLDEFAELLVQQQVMIPFHIVITGGAWMLLQKKRAFTEDIDFARIYLLTIPSDNHVVQVQVQNEEIFKQGSLVAFAEEFRTAAQIMARRHPETLAEDWLNDEAAVYYYENAPRPEVKLWQIFQNILHVYLPTAAYILATKIVAYREKDFDDIWILLKLLKITTKAQAQAIIDQFILPDAQEFWEIPDKLNELF